MKAAHDRLCTQKRRVEACVTLASPGSSSGGPRLYHQGRWCHLLAVLGSVRPYISSLLFFATLWTVAHQAPLSAGFPRPKYWSGLPSPIPGDLLNPETESVPLASLRHLDQDPISPLLMFFSFRVIRSKGPLLISSASLRSLEASFSCI